MAVPEELLVLILAHLEPSQDQQTVANLRLTNTTWSRLATPLLYRRIFGNLQTPSNNNFADLSILNVVQQLEQHPSRRRIVKELYFDTRCWPPAKSKDALHEWQAYKGSSLPAPVSFAELGLPKQLEEDMLREYQERTEHGSILYLLAKCTQIESLGFAIGYSALRGPVRQLIDRAASAHAQARLSDRKLIVNLQMFHAVRRVSLGACPYHTGLPDVLELFCLPQLEHLHVKNLMDNRQYSDHSVPKIDHLTRNTNHLTVVLTSCMLSGQGLASLLSSCFNLRTLTIKWRIGNWTEHLENGDIGEAIRQYGTKLESVCLDTADMYNWRSGARPRPDPSFCDLSSLTVRTMVIPTAAMHASNMCASFETCQLSATSLPPTVEELYILGVEPEEAESINVAVYHGDWLSNLKRLVLVPWYHYTLNQYGYDFDSRCVDYESVEQLGMSNVTSKSVSVVYSP